MALTISKPISISYVAVYSAFNSLLRSGARVWGRLAERGSAALPVRQAEVLSAAQETLVCSYQGEAHHLRSRGNETVCGILMRK